MDRRRGGGTGNLATDPDKRLSRQNLMRNRNRSRRRPVTKTGMRRDRGCPVVEGEVGQGHLGQDQDGGEQRQFKNQN